MPEQKPIPEEERRGGYGDAAGPETPAAARPRPDSGATGRDRPVTDALDADEALGNRTGGYGGNPPAEDELPER